MVKKTEDELLSLFDTSTPNDRNNHYFIALFANNLKPVETKVYPMMYFSQRHDFFKFIPMDEIYEIKGRKFLIEKDVDIFRHDYMYLSISEVKED